MQKQTILQEAPLEERIRKFTQEGYYNISNGFPFYNSQEFFDVIYDNLMRDQAIFRLPITATKEGIFIQTQPIYGEMQHRAFVEDKGIDPDDILFGSGIENFSHTIPKTRPYISVRHVIDGEYVLGYWAIKDSSDFYGKSIYNKNYVEKLKEIFEKIDGIEFYY